MEKVCNAVLCRSSLIPYSMIFLSLLRLGVFTSFFIFWMQERERKIILVFFFRVETTCCFACLHYPTPGAPFLQPFGPALSNATNNILCSGLQGDCMMVHVYEHVCFKERLYYHLVC